MRETCLQSLTESQRKVTLSRGSWQTGARRRSWTSAWVVAAVMVVGPAAADTTRSSPIVRITPHDLSSVPATPVVGDAHVRLTGGNHPRERGAVLFTSSDGHLTVDVSSYDKMTLEGTDAPVDEFMYFLEGQVEITDRAGHRQVYGPGDAIVVPKGFSGTWRQRSAVKKIAVMYQPPAATVGGSASTSQSVISVKPHGIDSATPLPVTNTPFMRVTSGNQPTYRSAIVFTSADGKLQVDVSSYDTMSLATSNWPVDEFMVFLKGQVEIGDTAGHRESYGPGDSIVSPHGLSGTWRQLSPVTKISVSYNP